MTTVGTETWRESFSREKPRQGRSTGRNTRKILAHVAPPMCDFCLRWKSLLGKGQERRLTAGLLAVGKPRQMARARLHLHEACVTLVNRRHRHSRLPQPPWGGSKGVRNTPDYRELGAVANPRHSCLGLLLSTSLGLPAIPQGGKS